MFENKEAQKDILSGLSQVQIEEIIDEYYSYIDLLKLEFLKYNKKIEYIRIDELNYIIKAM
ncbi:hypothetical protein [Clostridium polynesiense]|uniref:hypothetical protein n=1 Tax=Clostridium polynesiense TaxID=1325933 RepID=UPI00058B2250|nr:hypothetical protein [Clostridium polynesiense]